jgi:uncharacterized protein
VGAEGFCQSKDGHDALNRRVTNLYAARGGAAPPFGSVAGVTEVQITRNDDDRRYEARLDGELAGVSMFQLTDELVVITHTEVDERFEGHGIGSALARFALDDMAADGRRRVLPLCPFVKDWIGRHPDYHPLVYGAPASTARD